MTQQQPTTDDLLFVGFRGRVLAVDRRDGSLVWKWQSGRSEFVTLLPDGDVLFACCHGYTWALDPATGNQLWFQPLKGEGVGTASLATMRGSSSGTAAAAELLRIEHANAAAAASAANH